MAVQVVVVAEAATTSRWDPLIMSIVRSCRHSLRSSLSRANSSSLFKVCSSTFAVVGSYVRPCEGEVVCKLEHRNVPYFNAFIYLENKTQIGKVEDIFGSITDAVCQ